MSSIPIIVILILHVLTHLVDVGFGGETAVCANDPNPMCGTPVSGFFELGREKSEEFGGGTQSRLPVIGQLSVIWDTIQASWTLMTGVFAFNYSWLKSDYYLARFGLWMVQAILAVISLVMLMKVILGGRGGR